VNLSRYKYVVVYILCPIYIKTPVPIFVIRKDIAKRKRVKFVVSGGVAYYTTATIEISHYCIHKTPPLVPVPGQTI